MSNEEPITNITFNNILMTYPQFHALTVKLPQRGWTPMYSTMFKQSFDTYIGVTCYAETGAKMFFGIEEDGYSHT